MKSLFTALDSLLASNHRLTGISLKLIINYYYYLFIVLIIVIHLLYDYFFMKLLLIIISLKLNYYCYLFCCISYCDLFLITISLRISITSLKMIINYYCRFVTVEKKTHKSKSESSKSIIQGEKIRMRRVNHL